jgi:hypothetical protein
VREWPSRLRASCPRREPGLRGILPCRTNDDTSILFRPLDDGTGRKTQPTPDFGRHRDLALGSQLRVGPTRRFSLAAPRNPAIALLLRTRRGHRFQRSLASRSCRASPLS